METFLAFCFLLLVIGFAVALWFESAFTPAPPVLLYSDEDPILSEAEVEARLNATEQ